jgi:hypothetical protein
MGRIDILRTITLITIASGVALHIGTALLGTGGVNQFQVELLLLSCLPYVLCVVVLLWSGRALIALCGVVPALGFDIAAFLSVFVWPTSSTAPLILLFLPLWNLLLFVPLGLLVGWGIGRARAQRVEVL